MSSAAITATISAVIGAVTTAIPGLTLEQFQSETLWLLVVGFLIAFILAFAVGANDVANSFGTTVGAKTLTLRQACILASVFETLGAILLGAKVGETIRKGIIDPEIYKGHEKLLMVGEVSAMIGSGLWQLVATFLKLPVSGTHSIVGATVGFSLVAMGFQGVNWIKMGLIVASWFISPILAGAMAAIFYYLLRKFIFMKPHPEIPGLFAMPILYGCTVAINFFSVFFSGAPLLGLNAIPLWADFIIAALLGFLAYLIVQFVVVRKMRRAFAKENEQTAKAMLPKTPSGPQVKKTILPPALETIAEKEPLMVENGDVGANGKTNGNGIGNSAAIGAGDAPMKIKRENEKQQSSSRKIRARHSSADKAAEMNGKGRTHSHKSKGISQSAIDEAKQTRQGKIRSHSVGEHHSSVRIPPVLQLEKGVLKTNTHEPTVQQLKEAIRKNMSEPSMISLAENVGDDFFEVHINRQRRAVTIQRKRRTQSESSGRVVANGDHRSNDTLEQQQSTCDVDALLEGVPRGSQIQLEEPFVDSEDEETGLMMKNSNNEQDIIVLASDQKSYTGAIEEGFRKLSTSQRHDVIQIQVATDEVDEPGEIKKEDDEEDNEDRMEVRKIFSFLQILTACFGAFAHGGNDVSNAIGPLIALFIIYSEGSVEQAAFTPIWILLYGGVGICAGLWVWGRRVIKTMGEDLTSLTPSRGFSIELMSGVTVLAASNIGIPVSTTHCKVGAVVSVGWVRSRAAVDWKIFRNIVLAWFITVPVSGGLSAVVFLFMRAAAGL